MPGNRSVPAPQVTESLPRRQAGPADPCAMVIFGATGDLTKRLVIPALYNLALRAMGIRDNPIAAASPWQNGFAERIIGLIRRECLDHVTGDSSSGTAAVWVVRLWQSSGLENRRSEAHIPGMATI
jgi:hypothetical protein